MTTEALERTKAKAKAPATKAGESEESVWLDELTPRQIVAELGLF